MNYFLNSTRPKELEAACAVVGLYDGKMLTSACAEFDELCGGAIKLLIESGDLSGKLGSTQTLFNLPGLKTARVVVVGLGEQRKFSAASYVRVLKESNRALKGTPANAVVSYLIEVEVPGKDSDWKLLQAVLAADYVHYRYQATMKAPAAPRLTALHFTAPDSMQANFTSAQVIAEGIRVARELGNLPPNICTPAYLAAQAQNWSQGGLEHLANCSTEVLDVEQMQALGMGALLAVAQGSANLPKLAIMSYRGAGDDKPYVFVGKGITFDTGGVNIKPSAALEEMKFDMCGAAAVIGLMHTVARLQPKINVIGITALVENMCGGNAYRPSDVLKTMAGHSVEVLNTDAEGRLILCDALTYAQRFNPATLIDIATLTGACVVALGNVATGLLSTDDSLANELLSAGEHLHDRAWRLPLWDEYQTQLETGFADFANIGSKGAGAITAACFLSRFTEGQRWAHLDIAGTAWDSGRKGGATGRPVAMLAHWLLGKVPS